MDRRTFESPMDWEYQGTGPVDFTSPFTQIGRNAQKNIFATPAKPPARDPFADSASTPSPSKQPAPPTSSFFTPRLQGTHHHTASPFRNPAFTTPRKPFDDISEASGAESSPAFTEASATPNDTPDLDRFNDLNMATITPSRVNKTLRYGGNNRAGIFARKHAPGKGEIPRGATSSAMAVDLARKRKRRNADRDVSGPRGRYAHPWDGDSDSDSDDSLPGRQHHPRSRDKNGKKNRSAAAAGAPWPAAWANPDFTEQAHKMIRLLLHLTLVGATMFVGYKAYAAVHADISTANQAARTARLNQIAECTKQYRENQCVQNLPALRELCETWRNCMTDDPEAIFMVRNTIKEVASILNEFSGEMHLKSWAFFFLVVITLIISSHMTSRRIEGANKGPAAPVVQMQTPFPTPAGAWMQPPPSDPAYAWMHQHHNGHGHALQTPRRRHRIEMDEQTDTDEGTPYRGNALLAAPSLSLPQTPSRRSPSKGDRERERSPTKLSRSPTKRY